MRGFSSTKRCTTRFESRISSGARVAVALQRQLEALARPPCCWISRLQVARRSASPAARSSISSSGTDDGVAVLLDVLGERGEFHLGQSWRFLRGQRRTLAAIAHSARTVLLLGCLPLLRFFDHLLGQVRRAALRSGRTPW